MSTDLMGGPDPDGTRRVHRAASPQPARVWPGFVLLAAVDAAAITAAAVLAGPVLAIPAAVLAVVTLVMNARMARRLDG